MSIRIALLLALALHERDADDAPTRNRRIYTPGVRLFRPKGRAQLDFSSETALQLGVSRATTSPDDTRDLNHQAFFTHADLGYTFDAPPKPRVVLLYDYASGDGNPTDGRQGRFDTLFGARRFEFGPTGIYGAFARSNVSSPGARVEVQPLPLLDMFVGYRAFWLARARDAWIPNGLLDPTGSAGSFLGHQLEARAVFRPLPGNVTLELGVAHTVLGPFPRHVTSAYTVEDPTYAYAQITIDG